MTCLAFTPVRVVNGSTTSTVRVVGAFYGTMGMMYAYRLVEVRSVQLAYEYTRT